VLVGGDPGIGKSTLLLQSARAMAGRASVLYVSAEESAQQVKLRWRRLAEASPAQPEAGELEAGESKAGADFQLLAETDLELVLQELEALRPAVAIIDSIQALHDAELGSAPGSVSQVRECAAALARIAKRQDTALLLVGHVTKEGALAGPKVLEHLVDAVLTFEGDRFASHRLLRAVKNRFGATHELGVFEMRDRGLAEVTNPSELFLGSDEPSAGTATIVACEGTRPLVVEMQALVSTTSYASPRRSATGLGPTLTPAPGTGSGSPSASRSGSPPPSLSHSPSGGASASPRASATQSHTGTATGAPPDSVIPTSWAATLYGVLAQDDSTLSPCTTTPTASSTPPLLTARARRINPLRTFLACLAWAWS
jgi:KaiC/GvpD/RAD55 family RecA-like ATPase